MTFTYISLCSGIGGLDLAIQAEGGQCVAYCEIEPYCQEVLLHRMEEGWLDMAPIVEDLCRETWRVWRGVDGVVGGFPCQPFSIAGRRRGQTDARNLWPEVWRCISEVRPRLLFLENVPGLIQLANGHAPYVLTILGELANLGYDAR